MHTCIPCYWTGLNYFFNVKKHAFSKSWLSKNKEVLNDDHIKKHTKTTEEIHDNS